jgi:hypothetical protein
MLTMRDHGVEDYAALPDMDATDVGVLTDNDRACLGELGDYLVTTDAWQRFGIWLLHKHFEPNVEEVFVERAIAAPRGTETTPTKRVGAQLSATAIRFEDEEPETGVVVVGMEFAAPADFGSVAPFSDDDEAVLAILADHLRVHGKMDRFGVRLLRDPLGLADNELLHETCDSDRRVLHCTVATRGTMSPDTLVETTWRFRDMGGKAQPRAQTECIATCKSVGEGHDLAHEQEREDFGNN